MVKMTGMTEVVAQLPSCYDNAHNQNKYFSSVIAANHQYIKTLRLELYIIFCPSMVSFSKKSSLSLEMGASSRDCSTGGGLLRSSANKGSNMAS